MISRIVFLQFDRLGKLLGADDHIVAGSLPGGEGIYVLPEWMSAANEGLLLVYPLSDSPIFIYLSKEGVVDGKS